MGKGGALRRVLGAKVKRMCVRACAFNNIWFKFSLALLSAYLHVGPPAKDDKYVRREKLVE